MKDNMTLLVTEAKKGSQAAYEALYQKTKQMVFFTCFGLLKSEADATDQMQEAYATAFQKLDMLDDPEKFPGWINRIAINKCKDFLIQQKQWIPLSEEKDIPVKSLETEESFLPEAYIIKESMREIVQQIMQKELSDVQYQTILLYYYDGLSLSEIAEWMECSEGTVKSRLHNAKELIREGVQKYEQKHDDKLYSIAALPFLVRLLQMEAEKLRAPELNPDYLRNTKGQNPAYQQTLKQATKLKQGKGRLQMGQKGLFSTTAGKIIATIVTLLIFVGVIISFLAIANYSKQMNDNQ
ncbi:MAG: RNA polymerase sigma factor, partial [Lachnospiraceae bacterium]|nr:RNA polymerase sigma factor [Lachnospiraceae bacterium]